MRFEWKEYENNWSVFIHGQKNPVSVAILNKKTFRLKDGITGYVKNINAKTIEEAKILAEQVLVEHWKRVKKELSEIDL